MFDNPKKELEWLQQQLLAAENDEEEEVLDEPFDDIYDEFDEEEPYDEELDALLNGTPTHSSDAADWDVSRRAAGFDADDYIMDSSRYVPAPKKKSGCLTAFALIQALLIIGFVIWALGRML